MPILKENRALYPHDWKEISDSAKKRAGHRCQVCGIGDHTVVMRLPGDRYRTPSPHDWDLIHSRIKKCCSNMSESIRYYGFVKIILTTAHLDHDPANCANDNLKVMCQMHHNRYDAKHRIQTRNRNKFKDQLKLF